MHLTRRGAARLAGAAVFSSLALAGCHKPGTGPGDVPIPTKLDDVVASVTTPKGTTLSLTQGEFDAQLQSYIPNSPPQNFAPMGQPAGRLVMQQLVSNLLIEGLAQDQGVTPTDSEINTQYDNIKMVQDARSIKPFDQALNEAGLSPEVFKDLQVKPLLSQLKLLTKGVTITDADIQSYYNTNKDKQFTKPARVHIKRIVVPSASQAQAITQAIHNGQTFESQVALSLDKSTPDGDVLQWVPIDNPDPRMAAVIKPIQATPPGQVTPPIAVAGQNGASTYWLVKVVERKDKETLPFDKVKDLIKANILQQKAQNNPGGQQTIQQQIREFQTNPSTKVSIAGPQFASLVEELKHPITPAAVSSGGSPFVPAPSGKPKH